MKGANREHSPADVMQRTRERSRTCKRCGLGGGKVDLREGEKGERDKDERERER